MRKVTLALALAAPAVFGFVLLWFSSPGLASSGRSAAHPGGVPVAEAPRDPRLLKAWRTERGGWTYVHLEGAPSVRGFQHGYLLAPEIADAFDVVRLTSTHTTQRDWEFFRATARRILWPKIDAEYQQELQGIVEGVRARGVQMDVDDVVALNAMEEIPDYYVPWLNRQEHAENAPKLASPGNCSAFVAAGSYTRDHGIVMAHSNWTDYATGERWVVIFDIVPQTGHRILMDGFPGLIASDDDFGINAAGLMVTETTITQYSGFDPEGKAEFVRARKALQYAGSIDEYVRIMREENNGGYANDWLLADRKTGEIARFELGLKHWRVWRTKDGYFAGANFPSDPELIRDETDFDPGDLSNSANARRVRWDQLLEANKGRIDVAAAKRFLGDHYDSFSGRQEASERTLCGHGDTSPRGTREWEWGPYFPGGAVTGEAADGKMASAMSFTARAGHPCGQNFEAAPYLSRHPEYEWQAPILRDMNAGPWTTFKSGDRRK